IMTPTFDILGLGCVAIDDLLYVDSYPLADTKVQVRRRERQCGGLTGTALVAAARLGSKCAYAGTLGEDELSQFVLDRLAGEGIARTAGIPVVADFESDLMPDFPKLLELVDQLILSHEFAAKFTGIADARAAALELWSDNRRTVIVTCGPEGGWYVSAKNPAC